MNTLFDDPGFRLERALFTKRLLTEEEKAAIESEANEVMKELALFGIKRLVGVYLSPFELALRAGGWVKNALR
jgi:hypothetical protein